MFPHEPLPERIGPYKILRHLSSRGSADLYLGEHVGPMGFQRNCVLKLVPAPSSDDIRSAQELAHEARICARLSHPAIVRMHDFFEYGDRLVLVFEHFAGLSLARLLAHQRRRRMEMSDAIGWYIAHQLFSALTHAHALCDDEGRPTPVVHRDVQPAHIIISNDAQVRLTGFGIAKIAGTVGDTAIGFIKGTPAYMAPEQAKGEKVTERVDIYAAGLVVWEMLTGQSAIPAGQAKPGGDLLRLISGRRVDPISALRTDIPREIAAAIDACLEPVPEKRTIKCADLERWLKKVCDVNSGRDHLRERLVQMRNVSTRPAAPVSMPRSLGSPSKAPESVRGGQRFPGVATRVTGRVSTAAPGQSQAPPMSRRAAPVRASRSTAPPPGAIGGHGESTGALDGSDVQDRGSSAPVRSRQATLLGLAPSSAEVINALKAPRVPDEAAPAKSIGPRTAARARATDKRTGVQSKQRTLQGVAPSARTLFDPPAPVGAPAPSPAVPTVQIVEEQGGIESLLSMDDVVEDLSVTSSALEPIPHNPAENTALSRRRRTRRTWIGVAIGALAVFAIATVGVAVSRRSSATAVSPTTSVISKPSTAPPLPALSASVAVATSSAPQASVETPPAASSAPTAATQATALASLDLSTIPPGMGAILAKSPPSGVVYVNGVPRGKTDEAIMAPCGRRFIRVGTELGPMGLKAVSWLSEGQSEVIPCKKTLEISATPSNPIRNTPKKPPKDKSLPWSIAPF